jgi:hypothetical protein
MDAGAFVQENKRWLAGVAVGAVVWLIGSAVVDSVLDPNAVGASARKLGAPTTAVYDQKALQHARDEQAALTAERARLETELAFRPSADYQLGSGPADEFLFQVGRALKQRINTAASQRNVQVADNAVTWEVPSGIDEIKAVLFGLDLVDAMQQRLFAAHDRRLAAEPDAAGLRAITSIKLESRRGQARVRRSARPGEVDLRDLLDQERVTFQFQADEATITWFLESCRQPGRTLVIDSWLMTRPTRPGEVCTVKGSFVGIVFREGKSS